MEYVYEVRDSQTDKAVAIFNGEGASIKAFQLRDTNPKRYRVYRRPLPIEPNNEWFFICPICGNANRKTLIDGKRFNYCETCRAEIVL